MELTAYQVFRFLHITAGGLAAFLVFPMAFFSSKGSQFHKRTGYLAIFLSVLVAIAGISMLLNPSFPSLWARNIAQRGVEWVLFFNALMYERIFFVWLIIALLYFCFSAVRVWTRINSVNKGGPSYGAIDIALTSLIIISSSYLLFVGCWDIYHLSFHPFALFFIEISLYLIFFGLVDIATFIAPSKYLVKWGFILHGYKFFSAWDALLTAFIIRLRINYSTLETLDTIYSLLMHTLILVALWKYIFKKRLRGLVHASKR